MNTSAIVAAISPVVDAFEQLTVSYAVVGSIASSAHGVARATLDVDLVADLREAHIERLVALLIDDYYIDLDAALDAVRRRSMFNVVHLQTMLKVDVYVLTDRDFDQESFRRRTRAALEDSDDARDFFLDTAEDTILHKLEWYRAGGEVSERQWGDIVGVIEVQTGALDLAYLRQWAGTLGLTELLDRALGEAGQT
jgi:hypothetical protein